MRALKVIAGIAVLCGIFLADSLADPVIQCSVSGSGDSLAVNVKIESPHPGEMVIKTPDDRIIWLQANHIPFLHPVTDNFEQLSEFVLTDRTRGSWFNEWGEPEAVSVFGIGGSYEIIVSDNIESRHKNVVSYSCTFSIGKSDQ